ncbi:HlyD family efflux transporter periplasmic adaptor subunit [Nostoc sp.]|uniref:HlyD family efflux transporter periplasmic adaptor subunit n=1 Tax=Nostoc sp. TaxID=1180 RepID=UPI002FFAC656
MYFYGKSKKKFQTGVKWLVWSAILTVVSTGSWFMYIKSFNKSTEPVAVPTISVDSDNVEITINESGTLELGNQQALKSPGEVTIERVLIKLGARVKSGQQLVIFRNPEGQKNLTDSDLRIRKQELILIRSREKAVEAQNKLAVAQKEVREPTTQKQLEIQEQELNLARSRDQVIDAKEKQVAAIKELQDVKVLAAKGFISSNELEQQQEKVRETMSAVKQAELTIISETLKLQRLSLELKRQTEEQQKVVDAQSQLRETLSTVNTESEELRRLQIERQNLQKELQKNILTAPFTGKVLDLKIQDGDGVKSGDPLLTLGDPTQEIVKLELVTLDAAKVRVNQPVRIKVLGPNVQDFSGRVTSLYPQAMGSGGGGLSFSLSGSAKVPATIKLDKPSGTLIPGSQVSVEIIVQQRQKVVAVNIEAIQRSEPEPFVWVRNNQGLVQKRKVTLGLEGPTKVEVKSGLKLGEKIILPPPEIELKPGMPVTKIPAVPNDQGLKVSFEVGKKKTP